MCINILALSFLFLIIYIFVEPYLNICYMPDFMLETGLFSFLPLTLEMIISKLSKARSSW